MSSTQIPSEPKDHQAEDIETSNAKASDDDDDDDGEDDMVDTIARMGIDDGSTFRERFEGDIATIREFCKGLEYQIQFGNQRMLDTLECEGVSFLQLARGCLGRERQMNSMRGPAPEDIDT
jgi:hypothetical protein